METNGKANMTNMTIQQVNAIRNILEMKREDVCSVEGTNLQDGSVISLSVGRGQWLIGPMGELSGDLNKRPHQESN